MSSIQFPPIISSSSGGPAAAPSVPISLEFSRVSEEDRLLAMLGYKDLNRSIGPDGSVFYREEFCGACGIIHSNPDVLDTFTNCKSCHGVIREPATLRTRFSKIKQIDRLEVLSATYGDPYEPSLVIDVTEKCQEKVREFASRDRIAFKPRQSMTDYFQTDPNPGKNKQLRMRYRIDGSFAMLVLDFDLLGKIPVPFLLLAPQKQYLRIYSATYGHPQGRTRDGRMSLDVSETLQSLVDQNGGGYLNIGCYNPLSRLIGDPCPGYTKDLKIEFEIVGRAGELRYSEIRGHLTKRILLQSAPAIAPILYISSAFYGVTPSSRKDRLDLIHRELRKIDLIEHRRSQGLPVQPDEVRLLRQRPKFVKQREMFLNSPTKFIDVSMKLQRMADEGKYQLTLDKLTFDPNHVFGNPLPGQPKILEVMIDCQGHDAERLTTTHEMMDTGFSRNFITVKKHRFNIMVEDQIVQSVEEAQLQKRREREEMEPLMLTTQSFVANSPMNISMKSGSNKRSFSPPKPTQHQQNNSSSSSPMLSMIQLPPLSSAHSNQVQPLQQQQQPIVYRGVMQESLIFQTDYAAPLIIIKRATYGELNNLTKCIDVTGEIQGQVRGRVLLIEREVDLHRLFKMDPSPGRKKQLIISYMARGFTGNIRVREKEDCLVAAIELGYPPMPPPDDDNIRIVT